MMRNPSVSQDSITKETDLVNDVIRCSFQGSETKRVVTETIYPLKINMLRPLT